MAALALILAPACKGKKKDGDESADGDEPVPGEIDLWHGVPPLEPDPDLLAKTLEPYPGPKVPKGVSEEIELPFPPNAEPTGGGTSEVVDGPLEVLRYGPEGEQNLVDAIRVSFNQPMIPLSAIEDLRAKDVPVTIDPMPEGKWRWLGTRTVAFYPEGRLPFSTEYTVSIPEGVESTSGNKLQKSVSFEVATPTLQIASASPWRNAAQVRLESDVVLTFNQPVKAAAIADNITIKGGGKTVDFKLAEEDAWEDLSMGRPIGEDAEDWQKQRIVALDIKGKLSPDTTYTVSLPAGVYGEGDRKSTAVATRFSTYPPLKLSKYDCKRNDDCSATNGFRIVASTAINDPRIESLIAVSPEVENLKVSSGWPGIHLSGDFHGDTTYKVTVDKGLKDAFGQSLRNKQSFSQRLGPLSPELRVDPMGSSPGVIEVSQGKDIGLKIAGLDDVELAAKAFSIDDLDDILDRYRNNYDYDAVWPAALGTASWNEALDVKASRKVVDRRRIDLAPILEPGKNIVLLRGRSNEYTRWNYPQRSSFEQIAQVTDLGVVALFDAEVAHVQVDSLTTGKAVSGAEVTIWNETASSKIASGKTGQDGRAEIQIDDKLGYSGGYLTVKAANDAAYLQLQSDLAGRWSGSIFDKQSDNPRAFFFTDREPYKPGETVHVVGVFREETHGPDGRAKMWRTGGSAHYKVTTPRGIEVADGDVDITPFGTFNFDVETKDDDDTGYYNISLEVSSLFSSSNYFSHSFSVEEYRAPEFEVKVERQDSAPLFFGDELVAEIQGRYLFGAPMMGGDVTYTLTRSAAGFVPPQNDGFTFGEGRSWGWGYGYGFGYDYGGFGGSYGSQTLVASGGKLDDQGVLEVRRMVKAIDLPDGAKQPTPEQLEKQKDEVTPAATYSIAATVTDENRQAIAGSGSFVVHPASQYVGLRSDRQVIKEGEGTNVSAVVTDLEGARISGTAVAITMTRTENKRTPEKTNGRWSWKYETVVHEVGRCDLTSDSAPVECRLEADSAGTHHIKAEIKDDEGRVNRSQVTLYVHGKDAVVWDKDQRRVDLVADKSSYEPGETAKILVKSPFQSGRAIVAMGREGIVDYKFLEIDGGAATLEFKVDEVLIPSVTLRAVAVRSRTDIEGAPPGEDLGIPAMAIGQTSLSVSDENHRIQVAVEPSADVVEPGGTIEVDVHTTVGGKGTKAAVAVMVVDEGVLSLMGYTTPDPFGFFTHARADGLGLFALHGTVLARQEVKAVAPAQEQQGMLGASDDGDVWSDLTGKDVGEAYGVGGLGLVGTGRGGGGTGEGTIGLGNTGLIGKGGGGGSGSGYGAGASKKEEAKPKRKAKNSPGAPPPPASAAPMEREMAEAEEAPAADTLSANKAMAQAVKLRSVFATTAFFDANVETDSSGHATVKIEMPENLTSFRVMAVAIDPEVAHRMGSGEGTVRVRKPIMVRPSMPRFANLGDRFEGAVMVDNQTEEPQEIMVGTRGLNVKFPGDVETTITVPAGESKEVRFPMEVDRVGTMRVQFAVLSNAGRDATQVDLPVLLPATRQAFADYGMTDSSVRRIVQPPADVLAAFGGLELSFSSTALSGLEDAVDYLVTYPYECAEQTASRIIPIFTLGEVLDQFPIADVSDNVKREWLGKQGIERLLDKQNYDGGFGYWQKGESWPYLSNWVTFALLEGKRAGFEVEQQALDNALRYVENFAEQGWDTRWGHYYDWTSRAFSLWLLSGEGRGKSSFDRIWNHRDDMPLYARAMLMAAAHRYGKTDERDEIIEELRTSGVENARTLHFAESTSEAASNGLRLLMHSDVQTDAIVLISLLEVASEDEELMAKVMAGIMSERDPKRGGRWLSTHTNAWVLVSASRYFEKIEAEVPDYMARIWLDADFAGEHEFKGRSMAKVNQRIPMAKLLSDGGKDRSLTIDKDGPGKLYYRLGMRYAPADLKLKAEDQGFTVSRTYEAIPEASVSGQEPAKADPDAVKRNDDGTWEVKAGTNVRVNLTVVVGDRANYVVVDDPMPAGFEGQNPRFVTSVAAQQQQNIGYGGYGRGRGGRGYWSDPYYGGWWFPYYGFDHTQMRDERMLLFADQLPAGVYTYSYTARATSIGTFHLPPVHAEEMYAPERFGHSSSSTVKIVE